MKKIFIILMLGTMMLVLNNAGWTQAPFHAIDTILKAVAPNGGSAFGLSTVTIKGVIMNDSTFTSSSRLNFYVQDTGTHMCLDVFLLSPTGGETSFPGLGSQYVGARRGVYLQIQGVVTTNFGNFELNADTSVPAAVLGTGYSYQTTVLPNLAATIPFDPTLQSGMEYYNDRLIRVNNVYFVPPFPGTAVNNNNYWLVDASVPSATYGVNSINVFASTGMSTNLTTGNPGLFTAITSGSFGSSTSPIDFIGIASGNTLNNTANETSNNAQGPIEIISRGLVLDLIPHYYVNPTGPIFSHPGGIGTQLAVAGGYPPYTWSLSTTTTGQGSLNTTSGATVTYSPGSTAGTLQVVVTDSAGEQIPVMVTIAGTSAPLAPDVSMKTMTVPRETGYAVIKPSER